MEVKVDVPYNTSDNSLREELQQALINEFNPDAHNALKAVHNFAVNLHPQHRDLVLQHHEESGTSRLRNFVVTADVPEFAFPGSYRLELYLHPKNPQQTKVKVVNNTSVLGRANAERCAACKDRRAAGSQIRGYMPLDPRLILYLISQLDHTELAVLDDLEKLSVLVKESLGARLVKPDGTILAAVGSHIGAERGEALEETKAPALTLHSHFTRFEPGAYRGTTPAVTFEDHAHHGLFGMKSGWKFF